MKFLIDGHRDRVSFRMQQWPEGVAGQLLTPLTRYRRGHEIFAIDNGAFSKFNEREFRNLLRRQYAARAQSLFVAVPDKVGCHKTTLELYKDLAPLCEGYKKAFVAQDGYEGMPDCADTLFIGGTNAFKDSNAALEAVQLALQSNKKVHIGRVNEPIRFMKFHNAGAHTCDGSGVSRYDHMLPNIRQVYEAATA